MYDMNMQNWSPHISIQNHAHLIVAYKLILQSVPWTCSHTNLKYDWKLIGVANNRQLGTNERIREKVEKIMHLEREKAQRQIKLAEKRAAQVGMEAEEAKTQLNDILQHRTKGT